ncbi:MAG: MarR family winged helix-turn-helix transcriptional regulator [Gammaproteobacteria bacterium]
MSSTRERPAGRKAAVRHGSAPYSNFAGFSTEDPVIANNRKRSLGLKLAVISRQLRQRFDQHVERSGITRAKWVLIAAVSRNPGATQRSIAAALEVTEVTAGRMIDRLCADGYLERRENPHDRRGYCVYLTPAAQPVLDKLGELAAVHEAEIFAGFSAADLAQLDALLDRIAENLAACAPRQEQRKASGDDCA